MEKTVGMALAGHSVRVQNHKKSPYYDNKLTDLVNLIIAQTKADEMIKDHKNDVPQTKLRPK